MENNYNIILYNYNVKPKHRKTNLDVGCDTLSIYNCIEMIVISIMYQ